MKKLLFFVLAYLGISLLACQDGNEERYNPLRDLELYKNIGKRIPNETGARWLQFYREKMASQGRLLGPDYQLSDNNVLAAMNSVTAFTGIAFHHGKDFWGQHHFIVIPVDETLSLWSSIPGRKYFDANTNTEISQATARQWALSYENANPDEVWFHYFGRVIFDEIVSLPYFDGMVIEPALNDVELTPELLLVIGDVDLLGDLLGSGRTDTEGAGGEDGAVYDASSPCPPCAVN